MIDNADGGGKTKAVFLSDITAEADTIPTPVGFTFMIGGDQGCLEVDEHWDVKCDVACDTTNPKQEWAIEGNYIMSFYHQNMCLSQISCIMFTLDCDDDYWENEWEFLPNGAIVSANDDSIFLTQGRVNGGETLTAESTNSASASKFGGPLKNYAFAL